MWAMILRIIHGRVEIWNLPSSVQLDISHGSATNEWDIELNARREIPHHQATMYYFVYYMNTLPTSHSLIRGAN